MTREKLEFSAADLTPYEEEVKINDSICLLREASGKAVAAYQSAAMRGSRLNKSGDVTIGDIGEVDIILLSHCLFYKKDETLVPKSIIGCWNNKVIKKLVQRIKEVSGLDDNLEDDPEKLEAEIERLTSRLRELREDSLGKSLSGNTDGLGSPKH